jgi:hypothetical protein
MTPNAELLALAAERGVPMTDRQARRLRARLGEQAARDRVEGIGALMDLASALGRDLSAKGAAFRLDAAAGSYDVASAALVYEIRSRRERVFVIEMNRNERRLYAQDAHVRHEAQFGSEGSLGFRASMLLLAVEDAGLRKPDADGYRLKLTHAVDREIGRRYPSRPQERVEVIDADQQNTRHRQLVTAAIAEERQARDDVLKKVPELQQRIDALASRTLRLEVEQLLREMQKRITQKAVSEGWRPNPDRYRQLVIDAAWEAARAA